MSKVINFRKFFSVAKIIFVIFLLFVKMNCHYSAFASYFNDLIWSETDHLMALFSWIFSGYWIRKKWHRENNGRVDNLFNTKILQFWINFWSPWSLFNIHCQSVDKTWSDWVNLLVYLSAELMEIFWLTGYLKQQAISGSLWSRLREENGSKKWESSFYKKIVWKTSSFKSAKPWIKSEKKTKMNNLPMTLYHYLQ